MPGPGETIDQGDFSNTSESNNIYFFKQISFKMFSLVAISWENKKFFDYVKSFMKLFDEPTFLPAKTIFGEREGVTCAKFGDYFCKCFNVIKVDDFKLKSPVEVFTTAHYT